MYPRGTCYYHWVSGGNLMLSMVFSLWQVKRRDFLRVTFCRANHVTTSDSTGSVRTGAYLTMAPWGGDALWVRTRPFETETIHLVTGMINHEYVC